MNLPAEIQFLLLTSNPIPESISKEKLIQLVNNINRWDWFLECAVRNSVAPLVYYNLLQTGSLNILQTKYKKLLEDQYKQANIRNLKFRGVFLEIANSLISRKIDLIALKGISLQYELYVLPFLRPMTDIDILIKVEESEKALNILNEMGCKAITYSESKYIDSLKHHYPPLLYKGVAIELHRSLFDAYDPVQLSLQVIWDKAEISQIEGLNVHVLNKHQQLFYLCHHVFSTFRGGTVKLIWYIDLLLFLRKNLAIIEWDNFLQLVAETNSYESVYHSLGTVGYLFKEQIFEKNVQSEINKYCTNPQEILFHIENTSINPELTHYYQKFHNIKPFSGKLKYLKNRMFPSKDFIQRKYQTFGCISLAAGYLKELFRFIYLGFRIMYLKIKLAINRTIIKE